MSNTATSASAADYARVFAEECAQTYPAIDAFEASCGYAISRDRLEYVASVLACPVKAHAPNWQHGRVLYAATRGYIGYLATQFSPVTCLDIGTAKGFSALCLQWAMNDAGAVGAVISVDVIDPLARVRRNTVAEVDGFRTLAETLASWPEAERITFLRSTGVEWLERFDTPVHVAFIDGKHTGTVVHREGKLLASRQFPGDMVIFDDVQIPGVALAVEQLSRFYTLQYLAARIDRIYAIGVRR